MQSFGRNGVIIFEDVLFFFFFNLILFQFLRRNHAFKFPWISVGCPQGIYKFSRVYPINMTLF